MKIWLALLSLCCLVLGSGFLWHVKTTQEVGVLEVQELRIRDEDERLRISIGMKKEYANIVLYGADGRIQLRIWGTPTKTIITFRDEEGELHSYTPTRSQEGAPKAVPEIS